MRDFLDGKNRLHRHALARQYNLDRLLRGYVEAVRRSLRLRFSSRSQLTKPRPLLVTQDFKRRSSRSFPKAILRSCWSYKYEVTSFNVAKLPRADPSEIDAGISQKSLQLDAALANPNDLEFGYEIKISGL